MKLTERDKQFIREEIDRIVKAIEKLTEVVEEGNKPPNIIGPR